MIAALVILAVWQTAQWAAVLWFARMGVVRIARPTTPRKPKTAEVKS